MVDGVDEDAFSGRVRDVAEDAEDVHVEWHCCAGKVSLMRYPFYCSGNGSVVHSRRRLDLQRCKREQ